MESTTTEVPKKLRVAIVGAGLSGLAAAGELQVRGHEPVVFDKGRGPGGRASSRRAAPFAFDHGAQYFTAREPELQRAARGWLEAGVVARWEGRIVVLRNGDVRPVQEQTERFVGVPRMSSLARHLAGGIDVRCGSRVASIEGVRGDWTLQCDDGALRGGFDRLILTAPPAQAAELIGARSPLADRLVRIRPRTCWALLLGLDEAYRVDFDGAFCEESAFSWISRDNSKPGRPSAEAWVLHATPPWSAAHAQARPQDVAALLATELERTAGLGLPSVSHRDAHLWRFAGSDTACDEGILVDPQLGWVVAGDTFFGGRVEGAYRSGLAAARFLDGGPPRA